MNKRFLIIFAVFFLCWVVATPAFSAYSRSYQHYISLGQQSIQQKDYHEAMAHFETAVAIDPQRLEARFYLNLIKRVLDRRVARPSSRILLPVRFVAQRRPFPKSPQLRSQVQEILDLEQAVIARKTVALSEPGQLISPEVSAPMRPQDKLLPLQKVQAMDSPYNPDAQDEAYVLLVLDDALWAQQPGMDVEIDLNQSLVLQGKGLERVLVLTEGLLSTEVLDKDHIRLTASAKIGRSLVHVWESHGRWTFNVRVRLPFVTRQQEYLAAKFSQERESYGEPFTLKYSSDWGALYRGNRIPDMTRHNRTFLQWMGVEGPTPYGYFDASMNLNKFKESTEIVGKSIGLMDGHMGPFKNFNLRGYDTSKRFSELSLPGESFRGGLLDAYAFHRKLRYSLLKGQERAIFITSSTSDDFIIRRSYLEGAQLTLFPESDREYGFNYVRGYGQARPHFLKDKVYSLTTQQYFKGLNLDVNAEIAYDEETWAVRLRPKIETEDFLLQLNLRDIDKDFQTISGRPAEQGEAGGEIYFDKKFGDTQLKTRLDVYRDRSLRNPDNPNVVNIDIQASLYRPLSDSIRWQGGFYYINTPQIISPQRSVRINHTLTKTFNLPRHHRLSAFVGNTLQHSRFKKSASSEYDRLGIRAGMRLNLWQDLNYFFNYEYFVARDVEEDDYTQPRVLSTGLSYSRAVTQKLSGNVSIDYRDEQDAEGQFSFLAGEDSLSTNVGITYKPKPDVEVFLDTRLRNVWAENASNGAFDELDVRLGLRASWDTLFVWDPIILIQGVIYKDLDGNGLQGQEEPGLPGIKVLVGKHEVYSGFGGRYRRKVRAKRIRLSLDHASIPTGYVVTTALARDIDIVQGKDMTINFGLTTRSGIYGIVYVDENDNGQLDANEKLISNTQLTLDGSRRAVSDGAGSYFFENIGEGQHHVVIDVNSIPLPYLPKMKLDNVIEVLEGETTQLNIPLIHPSN